MAGKPNERDRPWRTNLSTGTEWEDKAGYSRAVRVGEGDTIHISGTTATNENGEIVGEDDMYKQCTQTLENIESALEKADASLEDVVRTRMFVTDVDRWEEIAEAHHEFFGDVKPSTTLVEIERLVNPKMLVEIEAEAVVRRER
ncbi:MAG: RidA family protein [Halobacteria archaeon]|nr:RidA family protein [Halobacteria archaeon]